MSRARSPIGLRPFLPQDGAALAAIFVASVEEIAGEDYGAEQIAVWTARADDAQAFAARLAGQLTLVATLEGEPVGFVSLAGPERIDMLYVHPLASRQGAGTALVDALEKLAQARGARHLVVDSSDTAEPFFARRGYSAQQRNTIEIDGVWLGNTTMRKALPANDSAPPPRRMQ
jgi:putative acetyltransferase